MQASEGKAARKCDDIAFPPTRGKSAEVTPNPKATEREQAQAEKIKKKGLEEFFGKEPRVQPPSREGTPIDVVVKKRGNKNKANDREEGKGKSPTTELGGSLSTAQSTKQLQSKEDGEGGHGGELTKSKKKTKKSAHKNSDDKHSRQSKRTRSDEEGSALGDRREGAVVNLEAIKGLLWKKGSNTPPLNGSEKKERKTATFTEVTSKHVSRKPDPVVKYKKCVVAFVIQVDKGKDTQAAFGKKLIAALSFLQTYIDKYAAFFAIDESDSSRPPIKEKGDPPVFQVVLRRYFVIPSERAFDSINQDGGRAIKGSAVMGFSLDPQKCLEEAAGDLRHMGCAIY
jgi:hypothetical protein